MKRKNVAGVNFKNWVSIYILGIVSLFNDMASEMIYPLIPVFIKSKLGLGASFIGIIEGIAESTNSILKLFSGWISDKTKKRKSFVLFGYTLSNIIRPLIGISTSWGALLGFRFSDRVGKGIRTAPRDAMLCDLAPDNKRGFAFGFQRAMDHTGAVIGPLIASFLLTYLMLDIRKVFLLSYIPGVIVILLIIFGVREVQAKQVEEIKTEEVYPPKTNEKKKNPIIDFKDFKKLDFKFKYFLSILIIFALGNSTDAFLLLRASDLGIKTAYIPMLWAALHVSKTIFSIIGGYISDKIGRKIMISFGWLFYSITYFGFAFAYESWHIWALFIFYGLFFGFTEGVEKAFVGDLVPAENRGLAYGFYNLSIGIAALPASLIFGFIWNRIGFKTAFITGAILSFVSVILLIFVKNTNKTTENTN